LIGYEEYSEMSRFFSLSFFTGLILAAPALHAGEFENLAPKAQVFRQGEPVTVQPDGIIVA